ncbi:hypothetical protein KOR34_35720 [Posidoniimonas corsicana]|uniref:Uncharacterized protein n=1 Tax=Posidoniimonas corsicana TaxID=1938618 RepID=A0A5C5V755_9BACT|nr:hypothetical protein [Posidoniimonas corsicana]TWT33739.1 hypothetical protein KOR34_35720 [Posidoniimonas corsicana]
MHISRVPDWRGSLVYLIGTWCCVAACGIADGREVAIGAHGASFDVRDNWRRQQLVANLGRDQFKLAGRAGYFATVIESERLLEGEEQLIHALRTHVQNMVDRPRLKGRPRYTKDASGVERATQSLEASVSGFQIFYNVCYLSQNGLTYCCLVWSIAENADTVDDLAARLHDGFEMPKPGSGWRRGLRPIDRGLVVGGHRLAFRFRPSVFRPADDESVLLGLLTPDQQNAIYVSESDTDDPNRLLNESFAAINLGESVPFKERGRKDITVGEASGRMLTGYDGALTLLLIALPVERGRTLDIRFLHEGKPDAPRFDRDLFLESLDLTPVSVGLDLPELPLQVAEQYRNQHEQELDRISTLEVQTSLSSVSAARRLADGRLLLTHGYGLIELNGDEERVVLEDERWGRRYSAAPWGGGLAVAVADSEEAKTLDPDGDLNLIGITADVLTNWGDSLLYSPPQRSEQLVGFENEPSGVGAQLSSLRAGVGGRLITTLKGRRPIAIAAAPGASVAAVSAEPVQRAKLTWGQMSPSLLWVDLETGGHGVIAEWRRISNVVAAGDQWLVSGTPAGKPSGVYVANTDGLVRCLLTGDRFLGVALEEERLWYTRLTPTGEGERLAVYSAPLADLTKVGPLCRPFCVARINDAAARWQPPARISTQEGIRAAFSSASEQCQAVIGTPLPTDGRGVDQLLYPLIAGDGLSPAAKQMVAVALTNCLLEQGAEWVHSDRGGLVDWLAADAVNPVNAFAEGHTPAALLTDTLYNADGYWSPGEYIVKNSGGRRVLLSLDPQVVTQAVEQAQPPGATETLESGTPGRLLEMLHSAPNNTFFRAAVYRQFGGAGDAETLRSLAAEFVDADMAESIDRHAWFSARWELARTGEPDPELASDLIDAINEHADEPVLYVLLGKVCDSDPQRGEGQSRVCYARALELDSWSELAEHARARISEIDNAASGVSGRPQPILP